MSSPCRTPERTAALALLLLAAAAGAGCSRVGSPAVRGPAAAPTLEQGPGPTAVSTLYPGGNGPGPESAQAAAFATDPAQIAAGQRYFTWYNCNGCHFNGGGGIGPALMDDKWIYGNRLDQIYHSIADGRPNGMPTWRGKIPDAQIWQLAAYVRSLSTPKSLQQNAYPKTPLEPATLGEPHQEPKVLQ